MDHTLPPQLAALADDAAAVAADWASRTAMPDDGWLVGRQDGFSAEMARRGWLGMTWPVEHGGGGRSPLERFVVFEQLVAGGAPLAPIWFADRQIGPTLVEFGTPAQRARWLPPMLAGEARWCIGISEPDAGSDVVALRTHATPDGDDWILDGSKVWTSGAAHGDWMYVVARTDPEGRPHESLSELVVDLRSPGVTVRTIADLTGDDHFCEVHFDRVRVPGDHLIGRRNGSFRQLMRQLELERGGIDRLVSNRLLYEAARRSPRLDPHDPVVRQELAAIETGYRIGRCLVLQEVLGQAPPGYSAVAKTFCTEHEQRVAAFCARIAGVDAMAWADDGGTFGPRAARNIAFAAGYTIMGGTTQVLRTIVAERLLGLPR